MKKQIEQVLDSREVAEMVGKQHKNLLADIRGYINELSLLKIQESDLGELKIQPTDFFRETTYKTEQNKIMPSYDITKKGCEFIAHKLTGIKGTEFTARYINRFHNMEETIREGLPEKESQAHAERLASVNNAVKILTPLLEKAGCDSKIQLLTAKQLYEKAHVFLPIEIQSDKRYWDTVHIARQAGIYYKSSGKPADKAVNEIIRRIGVTEEDYTDTWESKGKWQGTVRKYSDSVIDRVKCWIVDNDYPADIDYQQSDGQTKTYHVSYKSREVA